MIRPDRKPLEARPDWIDDGDTAGGVRYRPGVPVARRLLMHRRLAVLLCAATLLLKLLVPAGYMIGGEHGRIAIELCSGVAPPSITAAGDMAGMHHDRSGHGGTKDHGRVEMPCAFAGLTVASLAGADPIQLAVLIGFVLALGLCPIAIPAIGRWRHARPGLRAPPLFL